MRCGEGHLEDCVTKHLAPAFSLTCKTAGLQWSRGHCPACHGRNCLSLAIKSRSLFWNCHRKPTSAHPEPACEYPAILAAAAAACPQCLTRPKARQPATVSVAGLAPLLDLDDCAMRLRLACIVWDMAPREAAANLGMSRRTYYRAVSGVPNMARKRRSA